MIEFSGLIMILVGLLIIFAILIKKYLSQNAKSTTDEEDDLYFRELQKQQNQKKQSQVSDGNQNGDSQKVKKELLIFFGSQTGCAEKLAYSLSSEAEEHEIDVKVIDLEEFEDEADWNVPFYAVFFIATHGEGESTDNSKQFLKWLSKEGKKNNSLLKDLKFSVFGLGNSSYQHYCAMGKQLDANLEKFGGKRFYKFGIGDDLVRGQQEQDFNEWKTDFWSTLKKCFNPELEIVEIQKQNDQQHVKKKQSKKDYSIVFTDEQEINLTKYDYKQDHDHDYEFQTKQYLDAQLSEVINVYELRQNKKDGSTLHLIFDLKNTAITYETAQNLYIFPQNDNILVQDLASFLEFNLNQNIKLVTDNKKAKLPFPSPISVRRVLTEFCDFQGTVMKKTLKDLAQLTDNPIISKKLEFLASTEGKADYNQLVEDYKITLFQLLQIYNIRPTLEQFIQLTFRITPRAYTISSSKLFHPDQVHISCSLDIDTLPDNKVKVGLASQYFQYLQHQIKVSKQIVRINCKSSNFVLPENKNLPIVMVGPGAGITPFRAFLQENQYLAQTGKEIYKNMVLYFGCRHQNGDFIFQDELQQFEDKQLLKKLYLAFSRDQSQKFYVQDLIKQNTDEIYDQIENQAVFYLCGNVKMGKDVQDILEKIVSEKKNLSKEDAKNFVLEMEKNKKFIKELW